KIGNDDEDWPTRPRTRRVFDQCKFRRRRADFSRCLGDRFGRRARRLSGSGQNGTGEGASMMSNLNRRIERLEKRIGTRVGPQLIYITPNLQPDDSEETPWSVRVAPGVWAKAFGAPFSSEDIERLRREYVDGKAQP